MIPTMISSPAVGEEDVLASPRLPRGAARQSGAYNPDEQKTFLELIGRRTGEEDRRHFVTSLRRLDSRA